jgi:hypothetical protein
MAYAQVRSNGVFQWRWPDSRTNPDEGGIAKAKNNDNPVGNIAARHVFDFFTSAFVSTQVLEKRVFFKQLIRFNHIIVKTNHFFYNCNSANPLNSNGGHRVFSFANRHIS